MRVTPDIPMKSDEYADGFAAGVAACRMIRCVEHREVPPFNANEYGGGECAACAVEASKADLLKTPAEIRGYLDLAIRLWRGRRDAGAPDAAAYIDAFQAVRISLFGQGLPPDR